MKKFADAPKDEPTKINEFVSNQKNESIKKSTDRDKKLVQISVHLPFDLHKKLLLLKATESIKIKDFVIEAITEKINKI